jgi:hypothetical protein
VERGSCVAGRCQLERGLKVVGELQMLLISAQAHLCQYRARLLARGVRKTRTSNSRR